MSAEKVGRVEMRCSCGPKFRADVWSDMLNLVIETRALFLKLHGYPGHYVTDRSTENVKQEQARR